MSLIKNKTLDQVEREVDLYMYTTLINMSAGSSLTDEDMVVALEKEFEVVITPEELRAYYEPTVDELEEDYRLIYKHCAQ